MSIQKEEQLLTIPQLAEELQLPRSWFYERSRQDNLPGLRRLGKYVRIDRGEFYSALQEGRVR